jgi:hypothetical protein
MPCADGLDGAPLTEALASGLDSALGSAGTALAASAGVEDSPVDGSPEQAARRSGTARARARNARIRRR